MRNFVDNNQNISLANAQIPDHYMIGGALNNGFQSEYVPFTWSVFALDQQKGINVFGLSEEKFVEYRSAMLKQAIKMSPNIIRSSIRNYVEPLDYLKEFAQSIFGGPLQEVAQADCPSLYNMNLQNSYNNLSALANTIANNETQSGYQCNVQNLSCNSYLIKYEGEKDNQKYAVYAAMDFEGFELKYPMANMFAGFGNLFGFGNNTQQQQPSPSSNVLGHGDCDMLIWGSKNRYLLIVPESIEQEGLQTFIPFLGSLQMDSNLNQQFNNLIIQRMNQNMMQTAQYQAQTQANIQGNMYQQQKLTNMLRQNSQSISAGMMDSWNKKMDSQTRMSNNFSEAIRGVNTYQKTDGSSVEVGVSADHVYENKYGDVYGVSGNEVDNDLLNKLNWTTINKK